MVLKHRELVRTALRDEKTLAELETQLQTLQLEQARQTDPWELISTPPCLTRRPAQSASSPSACLVVGARLWGRLDLRSPGSLVYSEDELRTSLPGPLLERLSLQQSSAGPWPVSCWLKDHSQAQSVALIPVGQPDSRALQTLTTALQAALSVRSLVVSSDLVRSQLRHPTTGGSTWQLQPQPVGPTPTKLGVAGTPVAGWLLLDPTKEAV